MIIAWLNLVSLNVSALLFTYTYVISATPFTREESRGAEAYRECYLYRISAAVFMSLMVISILLWIWYPLPSFDWPVHDDPAVGLLLGLAVGVPLTPLWFMGVRDAGEEAMRPSKDTEMFRGVYRHIRHPQTLGEMPWFIAAAFFANSLFPVLWTTLFVIVFVPTMIHFEEKDLVKRFGDAYREYQRTTGALLPKLRSRKRVE